MRFHASAVHSSCPPGQSIVSHALQFMPIGPTSDRESTDIPSEEEYAEFYLAYGECFAAWSHVEGSLLAVYMFLMSPADYAAISASYFSTTGFRAKLELVDSVLKSAARVSEEQQRKWRSLFEGVSKKSRRRNELAHNTVFFGRLGATGDKNMFLGNAQNPGQHSRLHAHDLREIRQSFTSLAGELFSFWQELLSSATRATEG
jgi:hypothetical protein